MKIETVYTDGWHIVTIQGELILKHLLKARRCLEALESKGAIRIALDLTGTAFVDSSAITMILNLHKRLSSRDGNLSICGVNTQIASVFSIVNLQEAIPVYRDRAQFERECMKKDST